MLARRRQMVMRYQTLLGGIPGLSLPQQPSWARSNWQSYCVRLPQGAGQQKVMQFLLDRGISTRRGVMNSHEEEAYGPDDWSCGCSKEDCCCLPRSCRRLTQSEQAKANCIILPLYHGMTEVEQDHVAAILSEALA